MAKEKRLPFHLILKHERERLSLSQEELAQTLGCDLKTVGRWEREEGIPRPYLRRKLSELFQKSTRELGLANEDREEDEAHNPSQTDSQNTKGRRRHKISPLEDEPHHHAHSVPRYDDEDRHSHHPSYRVNLEEAPGPGSFHGRNAELEQLEAWIVEDECRLVVIYGMGGMGKTALAARISRVVIDEFDYVLWCSLHNAPPLELVLKQCIQFFSEQRQAEISNTIDGQIGELLRYLREHRCLLILDNLESLLQEEQKAGAYRAGYEQYGQLLRRIGESDHQSCLLLTSREKPKEVIPLEGKTAGVRSLHLAGVGQFDGKELLSEKELHGTAHAWAQLVQFYGGNPLALKLVAQSIHELFSGDIGMFLAEQQTVFGDINDLLRDQWRRLSPPEREVLTWLAIEREAITRETLREDLLGVAARAVLIETLESLKRRSMIETNEAGHLTLQPVIMEFVTHRLVERATQDFDAGLPAVWLDYAFIKAQAKDYIRAAQTRLLLDPISQHLLTTLGLAGIEQAAKEILDVQREVLTQQMDYLAANLLHLLSHIHGELRGYDFSGLSIRQAYLQNTRLPQTNFSRARFQDTLFTGTFGDILSVAFHPTHEWLAAGTSTGEIHLYDATSGTVLQTYRGHKDGVWSLAFCPDGSRLASASDDQTLRVWEVETSACQSILTNHTERVRAVAWSADGHWIASGSDDRHIRLWDTQTLQCVRILQGHTGRIWSVAFRPDGNMLASGSTDHTIRLWDLTTPEQQESLLTLQGHTEGIRSLAFHPDGTLLVSGSDDQTVRLWNVETGTCLMTLKGHTNRVWAVAFHPDGKAVISGSEDSTVRLWDIGSGQCRKTLQEHHKGVRCVAFSSLKKLASGGDDRAIHLWDAQTGESLKTLHGYSSRIWDITFLGVQPVLVSASDDQRLFFWNSQTGGILREIPVPGQGIRSVTASNNGRLVATGGEDQLARLWDARLGQVHRVLRRHTNWLRAVALSPDGKLLASGGEDWVIYLWDTKTGQLARTLPGHTNWVRTLAFSPDGTQLVSGGDDRLIRVWDARSGQSLGHLEGHSQAVRTLVFHPQGRILVSGSEDATIRLWDLQTHSCLQTLTGHTHRVLSVAYNADGSILVSSSDDGTIRLWSGEAGTMSEQAYMEDMHEGRIRGALFSPDGTMLVSYSDDGTIKMWEAQTRELLRTLRGDRPYEGMNITGAQGLSEAQRVTLLALGAVEE